MELLGRWQQILRRAVACLVFFLLVALYLRYKLRLAPSQAWAAWAPQRQRPRPRPAPLDDTTANTTLKDPTQHLAMPQVPLLGTLPSNVSSPTTMDCHDKGWRQYLKHTRSTGQAEEAGGAPPDGWQHDWQPAVSDGATLHECTVEVELRPCMCRRTVTALLPRSRPCRDLSARPLLHHIKATLGESTCGDLATLRGAAQKVVVFSLGGPKREDYRQGLMLVVPQIREKYPGWSMRVYTDNTSIPYTWACPLACQYPHLDFCDVANLPGLGDVSRAHPRVWRFGVFGDPLIRRYMLRDADAPVMQREVAAVDQWLREDKCYHVMRDNPHHWAPMLAGMFGGCTSWRHSAALAARHMAFCTGNGNGPGGDQHILKVLLWHTVKYNVTMHDSFHCKKYPSALPFPTQRVNLTWVGMGIYRQKTWRRGAFGRECPPACRPKEHQDWKHC